MSDVYLFVKHAAWKLVGELFVIHIIEPIIKYGFFFLGTKNIGLFLSFLVLFLFSELLYYHFFHISFLYVSIYRKVFILYVCIRVQSKEYYVCVCVSNVHIGCHKSSLKLKAILYRKRTLKYNFRKFTIITEWEYEETRTCVRFSQRDGEKRKKNTKKKSFS